MPYSQQEAKKAVVKAIGQGASVKSAVAAVDRTVKTYEMWRRDDEQFRREVDAARQALEISKTRGQDPTLRQLGFEEFRKEFLHQDTYRHQRAWIDVLEGREPEIVSGERYEPAGRGNKVVVNTPPFMGKSMTITIEYVTYRICMNPNVRVIIVSKRADQAKKFLYGIKQRLTAPMYAGLQAAFAPGGSFRASGRGTGDGEPWGADKIYVAGRDTSEKDPTVEALGIRGQIYGARADLIIIDDPVDLTNVGEWEKQFEWINHEVSSRLYGGKLLVVGTRVAPVDLYSELLNGEHYVSGKSPWTYLAQPAVLAYADDPKDWVTLWPRSSQPLDEEQEPDADGTYPAWDGPALAEKREASSPKTWALVYQQESVSEDGTFLPTNVWGSVNKQRRPGPLRAGAFGHPRGGLEGKYVIASMDPAMTGDTFTMVAAVDRQTQKRYVMNAWVQPSPSPTYIRDLIKRVTEEYSVNEWVIEQNAFQLFLIHDPEIQKFLASRGVRLTPHYSGRNKQDPDFGVASMSPLFGTSRRTQEGGRLIHEKNNLVELPDPDQSQGVKALIEQLIAWQPGVSAKKLKQDGPMAMWFLELRARLHLGHGQTHAARSYMENPYLSRSDRRKRMVIASTI